MPTHSANAICTAVSAVLPQRTRELMRLSYVVHAARQSAAPVVTVVGKYNHGKSSLLNALLGSDVFAVADRRETVQLQQHMHEGVAWLDAPGLDADVAAGDDALAEEAIWQYSDIRLLVHAAKEGELDHAERALLEQLYHDAQYSQRQTVLVLTQIDQIPDEAVAQRVMSALAAQLQTLDNNCPPPSPPWAWLGVSATRYQRGTQEGKQLLIEKSGIPSLQTALSQAKAAVAAARQHEWRTLFAALQTAAEHHTQQAQADWADVQQRQQQQRQAFEHDMAAVLRKVEHDLQPVLSSAGADRALEPDSFANMFKVTAGKQERARLQVAYSRACIDIDGVLIRHGVTSLPPAQRIEVESLNSVIVAVLGISVKFRDDLRALFSPAGQARLQREFGRYFSLCEEQTALQTQLAAREAALAQSQQAAAMLEQLRPPAVEQAAA
ncbi:hypothetical protein E8K88_02035 [Lampropedia aestuarii]|uniref:G domain-containing protein n=1 Tax=Lampropedia aestuarii TaxID=2562762 RepID=A0A4S5BXB2_9BURK|nr:GTPase [Lampropedia aestuarii]THJ36073.1 hypothetical protein E8K88_02035 [Lampropedia aestuarii]